MRLAIVGFAAGAALLQLQEHLPPAPWTGCALALLAGLGLCAALPSRPLARRACAAAAGLALGFCWAAALAALALSSELPAEQEGRDLEVSGTIASLPHVFEGGVRFNFSIDTVHAPHSSVPALVALAWYGPAERISVAPGQRWRFDVRLQRPHGNANPHGFDYEAWLLEQGIRATGYVRPLRPPHGLLAPFVMSANNLVQGARALLRARIQTALAGKQYAGVIVALVVGDQRAIAQSDWRVFNRTGIGHLVSISGLHITMVAGMVTWVVSALWRRSFFTRAQLPLRLPAPKAAALAGAAAALLYVLLAGFGIPAQRTLYMLCVVALALWCGRLSNVSHVLCLALGVVVLLDPWAPLAPGFWLSFGAVGLILYATTGRTEATQSRFGAMLRLALQTQYVVTLGLVPLTLLLFSQVSLASPLANALAIPLVSLLVTPLSLAGSILPHPLSAALLGVAHELVAALAWVLEPMSASPYAVWSAPRPPPWVFCFALGGTLWMLTPRGWPLRWLGILAWLPLLAGRPSHPAYGHVGVTAFDVGQGMALLLETRNHRLLYDTGPTYGPGANGANRVILPYLKARGIGHLDGLVVSHSDIDHAGGALDLLREIPVAWTATSLWENHAIVAAAPRHVRCAGGQAWEWDGVRFEMLQPALDSYANRALKPNARGCTLRITAAGGTLLLAADIEAAQEAALLEHARPRLRADVLLAPHHGSGTSSTIEFLRAVAPRTALFQVGYRNRYQHPKAEVYARYGELGIERVRTDESGALSFDSETGMRVRRYRSDHARYWYGR